jgi:hypothetical protein
VAAVAAKTRAVPAALVDTVLEVEKELQVAAQAVPQQ